MPRIFRNAKDGGWIYLQEYVHVEQTDKKKVGENETSFTRMWSNKKRKYFILKKF